MLQMEKGIQISHSEIDKTSRRLNGKSYKKSVDEVL